MTRLIAALVALALALGPLLPSLQAQGTTLFAMDFSTSPGYGMNGANPTAGGGQEAHNGVYYDWAHLAAGGPNGTPASEITMIDIDPPLGDCTEQGNCEGYVGHGNNNGWAIRTQGTPLYVRIYLQFANRSNPRRIDGSDWGGKFIYFGDNCEPDTDRFIWNIQGSPDNLAPSFNIDKNTNGIGIEQTLSDDGEYHAYQVLIQSSSTSSATDGFLRLWIDGAAEGSPTATSGTFAWSNQCFHVNQKVGGYMDWMTTGTVTYRLAALEVATAFDPNWFTDMGEAPAEEGPTVVPTGLAPRFRGRIASVRDAFLRLGGA